MTNWFDSTSLKKTSWPDSGHLIQRFSGTSRRARKLRIFGRTTLEIQFMNRSQRLSRRVGDSRFAVAHPNRFDLSAWAKSQGRFCPPYDNGVDGRDKPGH